MARKNNEYLIFVIITTLFSASLEKILYLNEGFNFFRFFVTSFLLFFLVFFINKISGKNLDLFLKKLYNKFGINRIFIFLTLTLGIISSILVPFNEIPDEITHINYVFEERGLDVKFNQINDNYKGTPNIVENNKNKINYKQYFDFSKNVNQKQLIGIPRITIIRHFPQAIGTIIGDIFHLPVVLYLLLCEILALLFYVHICNKALTIMPYKKNTLMMIMLLPICVQQMSSFSYDVVLNSFCFLFFALIYNYKFSKEKIYGLDIIKLILCLLVIAICKIPYIILGLLIFILPFSKFEFKIGDKKINYEMISKIYLKHKYIFWILFSVIVCLLMFFMYKALFRISVGRVLIASISDLKNTLSLMKRSIDIFMSYYFETLVGNLGLFNIKTPIACCIIIYFSLFMVSLLDNSSNNKNKLNEFRFSKFDWIIIIFLFFIMIYIIILAMFEWTLYATGIPNYNNLSYLDIDKYLHIIPYIGGVQGRYFLPLFPLIFLPINIKDIRKKLSNFSLVIYQFLYYIFLFLYILIILLFRFWI